MAVRRTPAPRFARRIVAAVLVAAISAASAAGCVGQLGRNDDKVKPGSKGPSAANQ